MSITKIEISIDIWETTKDLSGRRHSVHKGKEVKTITKEEYEGDFERLILKNLTDYKIQDYAEGYLNMIEEDDCDCEETSVDDIDTCSLIYELKQRGYEAIKCETIADNMRLEKVKELMQL